MELHDNLPLPAYYSLCDEIEKRINYLEFLSKKKISSDEASSLRTRLESTRRKIYILEQNNDTSEKIIRDLETIEKKIVYSIW
jgi:hypothetical protein